MMIPIPTCAWLTMPRGCFPDRRPAKPSPKGAICVSRGRKPAEMNPEPASQVAEKVASPMVLYQGTTSVVP